MKNIIKITAVLYFVFFNMALSQDIKLSLDLGGSQFEFLEPIRIKVYVKNESNQIQKISTWDYQPDFRFVLVNSNGAIYPSNITIDLAYTKKTIFYIDAGKSVFFPNHAGYYDLSNYYLRDCVFYIPEDKYTVYAEIEQENGLLKSNPVSFEVIAPKNKQAYDLYMVARKMVFDKSRETEVKKIFEEIINTAPNSIYSSLALNDLHFLYDCRTKRVDKKKEVIDKMLYQMIHNLPNNRYAYSYALMHYRAIFKGYKGNDLISKKEGYDRLRSIIKQVKNPELRRNILIDLGEYKQDGLRIEVERIPWNPPPEPE